MATTDKNCGCTRDDQTYTQQRPRDLFHTISSSTVIPQLDSFKLIIPPHSATAKYIVSRYIFPSARQSFAVLILLSRRPVRRFIVSRRRQLVRLRTVRQHHPNLSRAVPRGFKHNVPAIRCPRWTLVPPCVPGDLNNLLRGYVHHI